MNNQKQTLLATLERLQQSVSLPELLQTLGPSFSERSVRRWLNEFSETQQIIKTGQKRGTRYQMVHKIQPSVIHSVFSAQSQHSIAIVRKPIFERHPVAYHKEWLAQYQPNKTYYLSSHQRNLLHTHGKQDHLLGPAGTFARKIYARLLVDLSYYSSRLEGNTYSIIETEKLVLEGIESEGKLNEEKVMILNHKEAIRHLVDQIQKIAINMTEICTLHYLLSDALVLPKYAGKIRDHGVRISASTYIPLEHPTQLHEQLNIISEKASAIIDPFEQSFFLLTHIAYLQAFTDVNKRTARLSANIPLLKHNVVPLSFNAINKEDYLSAMIAVYELNDTNPLADLYSFSYLKTCQEYKVTLETLGFDETRVRFRQQRREIIKDIITHQLIGKKLEHYITTQANKLIPTQHKVQFKKNIQEDLMELTPQRIAGMGISLTQLKTWLLLKETHAP